MTATVVRIVPTQSATVILPMEVIFRYSSAMQSSPRTITTREPLRDSPSSSGSPVIPGQSESSNRGKGAGFAIMPGQR